MQDLVKNAMANSEEEEQQRNIDDGEEGITGQPRIVVVGCGGAGNNSINRLYNIGVDGADTVAINTDKQHLKMIGADKKMLVGKDLTNGLGAGGDPDVGEQATRQARTTIEEEGIGDADMVFVTAGMGGGTGTGAAPVVAEIAKEKGAVVMSMVSTPFDVERARLESAEEGLNKLRQNSDSVIVMDNNRLLDYVPDLPIGKAFSVMDQIIAQTVKGISETITQPSLINLDYADMRSIMEEGGVAVMLYGESEDTQKSEDVVQDAVDHPLLDVDYRGASGGLVHITGGPDLTLREAEGVADGLTERLGNGANVIWGARIDEQHKGKIRVMAIMTGVDSSQLLNSASAKTAEKSRQASKSEKNTGSNSGLDVIR